MTTLRVVQGDITEFTVDAIVNAANSRLMGGGGVDGAIHRAGGPVILRECQHWVKANGPLATGEAMATSAGELSSRFVIHTVGPVYAAHPTEEARRLLARCYVSSIETAIRLGCASVAFPNISTGVFGYPKEEAAEVAVSTISGMRGSMVPVETVVFVCFDDDNARLYSELVGS